ncbi:MAG: methionyl-tRNA formyltransferase, partial [Phycisphaerales bacterium]
MKILFLGAGAFAVPTLAALIAERSPARIAAIITQPDRPAGRGRTLTPTPIGQFAAEHAPAVPLLKPADVNAPEVLAQLAGFDADAAVVIAFGQKLSPGLVATVRDGRMMNLHGSLLPRWRGAAPIERAIEAGDTCTGVTIMQMDAGLDTGPMHRIERTPIGPRDTGGTLHDRLARLGAGALVAVLR